MSLEAIKQITLAEEECAQRKASALHSAKKPVADAEKAGQSLLESKRAEAEAQAAALLTDAEAQAAAPLAEIREETNQACSALTTSAEAHLDEAAELIVRRVVNHA